MGSHLQKKVTLDVQALRELCDECIREIEVKEASMHDAAHVAKGAVAFVAGNLLARMHYTLAKAGFSGHYGR